MNMSTQITLNTEEYENGKIYQDRKCGNNYEMG